MMNWNKQIRNESLKLLIQVLVCEGLKLNPEQLAYFGQQVEADRQFFLNPTGFFPEHHWIMWNGYIPGPTPCDKYGHVGEEYANGESGYTEFNCSICNYSHSFYM